MASTVFLRLIEKANACIAAMTGIAGDEDIPIFTTDLSFMIVDRAMECYEALSRIFAKKIAITLFRARNYAEIDTLADWHVCLAHPSSLIEGLASGETIIVPTPMGQLNPMFTIESSLRKLAHWYRQGRFSRTQIAEIVKIIVFRPRRTMITTELKAANGIGGFRKYHSCSDMGHSWCLTIDPDYERADEHRSVGCVNFKNQASDAELEAAAWQRSLEKWHFLLTLDSSVSLVGSSLAGMSQADDGMQALRELFGRKKEATVKKRAASMLKYVKYLQEHRGLMQSQKPERVSALGLTVDQVAFLEFCLDDADLDLQVRNFIIDTVVTGRQCKECQCLSWRPFAVCGMSPGGRNLAVAEAAGLPLSPDKNGPLLPVPLEAGGWSERAVTTDEAGGRLRALLSRGNKCTDGVTGHSLKTTTLDWCGKFGVNETAQTLLGHHALKGSAMYAYMRDKLAAPLRIYERMLRAIRDSLFIPDATRSGLIRKDPPPAESSLGEPNSDRSWQPVEPMQPGLGDPAGFGVVESEGEDKHYRAAALTPEEAAESVLDDAFQDDGAESAQAGDGEEHSSSSSSSESEGPEGSDWVDSLKDGFDCTVEKSNLAELDFVYWRHDKTMTIHSVAAGSTGETFTCGRKRTPDYSRITQSAFAETWDHAGSSTKSGCRDVPVELAMAGVPAATSFTESKPAFVKRALEVGLAQPEVDHLVAKHVDTLSKLAFVLVPPGKVPEDEAVTALLPAGSSQRAIAGLKRLLFEAHTLIAEEEVAHGAYDVVFAMAQKNELVWLAPEKFGTRRAEISSKKNQKELVIDGTGVAVKEKAQSVHCAINSDLDLVLALRRRALAFDLVGILSFDVANRYHQALVQRLRESPPPDYAKVSLAQVIRADRPAFLKMAEILTTLRRSGTGVLPLDSMLPNILLDPSVAYHLLPLHAIHSESASAQEADQAH
ncbi:unnamed protein product [Symbiodinium sp. CCMP2592]|nr:unnamed protein product [Symbiodinium sp. CCMP2592]